MVKSIRAVKSIAYEGSNNSRGKRIVVRWLDENGNPNGVRLEEWQEFRLIVDPQTNIGYVKIEPCRNSNGVPTPPSM